MFLIHMPLKRVSVRVLVNTAFEIARISVHSCQRQSKVVVHRVLMLQLQVTRQLDDFGERFGARWTRFRAVGAGVFRSQMTYQLSAHIQ